MYWICQGVCLLSYTSWKARPFLANAVQIEHKADFDFRTTLLSEFPDVIKDSLNDTSMTRPPMELEFDSTMVVIPKRFNYVKQTPLHLRKASEDVIQERLQKKIITPVQEPTEWCSLAFFVGKLDRRARLVTNFIYLNKFLKCPVHPFRSPKDILRKILAESKCVIALDCCHGCFQMALSRAQTGPPLWQEQELYCYSAWRITLPSHLRRWNAARLSPLPAWPFLGMVYSLTHH